MKNLVRLAGKFHIDHYRNDKLIDTFEFDNAIVDEGLNHILDVEFNSEVQEAAWYIGLVGNSGWTAFNLADTMASHAGWAECVDYTEVSRPAWTVGAAASRAVTNAVTVDFNINATKTLKGIFVCSDNTKGGAVGILWAEGAFTSTVSVENGDIFKVTYTVSG